MPNRTVFFVSDGTGITAETFGNSILAQFPGNPRHIRRPFVDTVDKMQGQEADTVLVSYGVADPEFALREAEFIYGLNRLNVAVRQPVGAWKV